jgi:hypothetical protein
MTPKIDRHREVWSRMVAVLPDRKRLRAKVPWGYFCLVR